MSRIVTIALPSLATILTKMETDMTLDYYYYYYYLLLSVFGSSSETEIKDRDGLVQRSKKTGLERSGKPVNRTKFVETVQILDRSSL